MAGTCRHKGNVEITNQRGVFSIVWSVLSQCNTRLRLLHLLYDRFYTCKNIKYAFSMFYTLVNHGFLTNQSAGKVLSNYIIKRDNQTTLV